MSTPSRPGPPTDEGSGRRRRGWLTLYALSFLLLLGAAACAAYAARDFLSNLTLLRVSAGLSAGAIVLAIVSLALPRSH